jgi:hypothetical protein
MWMRRRPPKRAGRGTGYEPVYADSGALRAIAAGLSADAAAALAAVAPDVVTVNAVPSSPYTIVPVAVMPERRAPQRLVRLGFADDSEFDIDASDPWARALLAIAAELLAVRRPAT